MNPIIRKDVWENYITYKNLKSREKRLHTLSSILGGGKEKLREERLKIEEKLKGNGKDTIPKTMSIYLTRLNNIFHDVFNEPVSSDNLHKINDYDKIIKAIRPDKPKERSFSIKEYTRMLNDLTALVSVGSRYDDSEKMKGALTKYRKDFKELTGMKNLQADESQQTTDEKAVWTDLEDIKKSVRAINPRDSNIAMMDKALLSLYVELPPRRLEYASLIVKRSKNAGKGTPPKDDKNYIEVSPQNIVKRICLNRYKTHKTYGMFCFTKDDITTPLVNALKLLLDKREDGSYLFQTKEGKQIPNSNFTTMVKEAFMRRVGKPLRVNDIRHIYASKLWERNPTMNELKENAVKMGHSVETNLNYRRVDEKSEKEKD